MPTMKITAPVEWLDIVEVAQLRTWFLARGFVPRGQYLVEPQEQAGEVLLPENLREFRDWRSRLLEAIEQAAELEGITAAEWFQRLDRSPS